MSSGRTPRYELAVGLLLEHLAKHGLIKVVVDEETADQALRSNRQDILPPVAIHLQEKPNSKLWWSLLVRGVMLSHLNSGIVAREDRIFFLREPAWMERATSAGIFSCEIDGLCIVE